MTSQDMPKRDSFGYLAAFLGPAMWGLLPLFYLLLDEYSAIEIVVQRSLWAFLLLFVFYAVTGYWRRLFHFASRPLQMLLMFCAAVLIAINWTVFVYAVGVNRVVEASFGYFIYPLFAVAASVIFLGERLDRRGQIALSLSVIGVAIKGSSLGYVPDISLALAISFALYAVVRKHVAVDSLDGFFAETILLLPVAVGYLAIQVAYGGYLFFDGEIKGFILAVACGVITTVPLVLFLRGNKAMPLSMAALIFYVNPSLQLLCGVVFFGEDFSTKDLMAFGCIWAGLFVQFARGARLRKARF